MRQRSFGDTDLTASEIAFGTWALGSTWWGDTDDADRLIGRALDLGVTFFDTGNVYGQGGNEEMVGRVLRQADRDSIQISTKFGYVLDSDRQQHSEGERPHDWSPAHARRSLEGSLSRLGVDHVDLYQLHNPRMDAVEDDELFAELEALRDEGKIRHYGVALGPAIGWRDEGVRSFETRDISALQTVYNLLEQQPGDDFLAAAEEFGGGVMARVPTSSGLLEDKYTLDTTFGAGDHRRHRPRSWLVEGLQKIDKLRFLVIEGERTMTQAALKFILAQPRMTTVIPTIGTIAELEEFAGTVNAPDLTDDEIARVQDLYERNFDVEPAAV